MRWALVGIILSGCGYHWLRTPLSLHGAVHGLYLERVENHTPVLGIEGALRREVEVQLLPYFGPSLSKQYMRCLAPIDKVVWGFRPGLEYEHLRDRVMQQEYCMHISRTAGLVIRLVQIDVWPTGFRIGKASPQELHLRTNALLATHYTVTVKMEVEVHPHTAYGGYDPPLRSMYVYTDTFLASAQDSDPTGASRNELLNQLRLEVLMKKVAKQVSVHVYDVMTSGF